MTSTSMIMASGAAISISSCRLGGLATSKISTEILDVAFYANDLVSLIDAKTHAVLPAMRIATPDIIGRQAA